MRASSVRTAATEKRSPAPRKGGSSRPCSPTSPSRSSTNISPRRGQSMGDFNARAYRRRKGLANYRLVRYADDFVVMVAGSRDDAEGLRDEVATGARSDGPAPVGREDEGLPHRRGLRLSRLAHPASAEARHHQTLRLHLPVEEGAARRLRPGADVDEGVTASDALRPAATGSTRCCGDGPTTSDTACPRRPSATSTPSPGDGSWAGFAANTTVPTGAGCAATTYRGGDRRRARRRCSTRPR